MYVMFRSSEEGRYQDQYGDWHVICHASGIMDYDRRTSELSNAALDTKQDITSIENYTSTHGVNSIENKALQHRLILENLMLDSYLYLY